MLSSSFFKMLLGNSCWFLKYSEILNSRFFILKVTVGDYRVSRNCHAVNENSDKTLNFQMIFFENLHNASEFK